MYTQFLYVIMYMSLNSLSKVILDSAFRIHSAVGPGLYEHVYEVILAHELRKQHRMAERQVPIPIVSAC
jgi:GxxExxY protein